MNGKDKRYIIRWYMTNGHTGINVVINVIIWRVTMRVLMVASR